MYRADMEALCSTNHRRSARGRRPAAFQLVTENLSSYPRPGSDQAGSIRGPAFELEVNENEGHSRPLTGNSEREGPANGAFRLPPPFF